MPNIIKVLFSFFLICAFMAFAGCGMEGDGEYGEFPPQDQTFEALNAPEQNAILDADSKPANIDSTLGGGAHANLVHAAYDAPMLERFFGPADAPFENYAVVTLEASIFDKNGDQHYLNSDIQYNHTSVVSTAGSPPNIIEFIAPHAFVVSESLQGSYVSKFNYAYADQSWRLDNLAEAGDPYFMVDTRNALYVEGETQSEKAPGNFFRVIFLNKTQFILGAHKSGDDILVYIRVPTKDPDVKSIVKITLKPESAIPKLVTPYPLTYQQWSFRSDVSVIWTDTIDGLGILSSQDIKEFDLAIRIPVVFEFSAADLPEAHRERVINEVQAQPELLFVMAVLTHTTQITMGKPVCPGGGVTQCQAFANHAIRVGDNLLVLDEAFFAGGGTVRAFLRELISHARNQLAQRFSACFDASTIGYQYAHLMNLSDLRAQKDAILDRISDQAQRSLAAEDPDAPPPPATLARRVRERESAAFMARIDERVQEATDQFADSLIDLMWDAAAVSTAPPPPEPPTPTFLGIPLPFLRRPPARVPMSVRADVHPSCLSALDSEFRTQNSAKAALLSQIETHTKLKIWNLSLRRTYPQFDMLTGPAHPIHLDVVHKGEVIGYRGPVFDGDQPLTVVFAIEKLHGSGQRLSFLELRLLDLVSARTASNTLVFRLDTPDIVRKAGEWLDANYPRHSVRGVIIDSHGLSDQILLGDDGYLNLLSANLADRPFVTSLRDLRWDHDGAYIFFNACLLARGGGGGMVNLVKKLELPVPLAIVGSTAPYYAHLRSNVQLGGHSQQQLVLQYTKAGIIVVTSSGGRNPAIRLYNKRALESYSHAFAVDPSFVQ